MKIILNNNNKNDNNINKIIIIIMIITTNAPMEVSFRTPLGPADKPTDRQVHKEVTGISLVQGVH